MLRAIRYIAWTAVVVLGLAAGLSALGWRGGGDAPGALPFAARVGGPFELTAADGSRFSSKSLAGKPYAVFFGFTNCPDVCPTTLLEMSNAMETLGAAAAAFKVIYITVDPERDTAAFLKTYMANFDKRIVGLTGTAEEIAAVTKAFRAVYKRVPTKDGYTMDHTATVYLMDGRGELAGTISYQEDQNIQLGKLRNLLARGSAS
jgi:protein SCO1